MSKRTREAERQFGDALRVRKAFQVKATPDYKALARARKVERRWHAFAYVAVGIMVAIIFMECLRVV